MRVAVGKIDGVRDVKVSLNEGLATIQFAPTNHVSIDQVRKAIRSNGFTPRQAEVRVAGLLVSEGDSLLLKVSGSDDAFALQDGAATVGLLANLKKTRLGTRVTLDGQIPERSRGARPDARLVLLMRSANAG